MNTYKAILDTRRPNGVIATITQFDNATLALQIVTNGEIDQPWEAPHFELIAMKRDQQAVRESDQAAFTINDAGEHRVTVDLKEQFLTCRGSVKMQFIVKDGDRLSTSIFYVMVGESLDHDIIESHRDVAVLDELETYVRQGFDDLAYQEQRMKDVEKATHELNELMVGNEAERQAAEANRQALFEGNESQRQNTFNQQLTSQRREFDTSQADREGVFNALKQNLSSEFAAAQNEREREFDRVMASNQTQFNDAETSRASTFSHRQLENERTFTANENARQTLFNANEAGRQTNEAGRVSNENTRKTNEAERVAAEANRQQKMSEFEAKATQLSDELDAQVARVDAFVSANEEKLLGDRDKVDYMGNTHESVKAASDANVDWLLGEVNTAHYEGQHITATETIEGRAKSAILTGQTLVNLLSTKYMYCNLPTSEEVELNSSVNTYDAPDVRVKRIKLNQTLQANKKYILLLNVVSLENGKSIGGLTVSTSNEEDYNIPRFSNTGLQYKMFETKFEVKEIALYLDFNETTPSIAKIKQPVLMEYQEGMENWDIPYFEGMQSVKMPVLTATGKNLFDGKLEYGEINVDTGIPNNNGYKNRKRSVNFIKVEPNTSYVATTNKGESAINWRWYDDNKNFISSSVYTKIATSPNKAKYLKFYNGHQESIQLSEFEIQIEQGSVATPYEPYKSNILTVNEPVELRGIGDVKDELNLMTGELTQCIKEVVLNGSQTGWSIHPKSDETYTIFYGSQIKDFDDSKDYVVWISDKFANLGIWNDVNSYNQEYLTFHTTKPLIKLKNTALSEISVNGLNTYLSQSPITVQYKLSRPTIKTVDLSDNHVYSYKDVTHYDCSSAEGSLVPTLSIDVPTNLPAVVTRQRATIQELEKENAALKNEIEETANSSVNGDLELMSSQFELDFRLFEIEMNLDMPMMATMRGVKSMAMTVYQQAKTLILAGKYEREDMEYKLNRYKAAGRITVEEYDELIALMDARELVD